MVGGVYISYAETVDTHDTVDMAVYLVDEC